MELDQKTKDSIKWMAIYGGIASAAEGLANYFATSFFAPFGALVGVGGLPVNQILNNLIWGAVSGAIFGFVLSRYYVQIIEFNRKYLWNFFGSLFKLLFYPYVIGGLFGLLGGGIAVAAGAGVFILVAFGATLVIRYFYAKMVVAKLSQYYQ
jgi:hypothetical protein